MRARHLSTAVLWLGALALVSWGGAAALVGFQAAGVIPAPIAGFTAIVAATLTLVAVFHAALDRRDARVPHRAAGGTDDPTVALIARVGSTGRVYRTVPMTVAASVPRPRAVAEPVTTGGHRRSQDYWDGVADVSETLLENRGDDPGRPPTDPDPDPFDLGGN